MSEIKKLILKNILSFEETEKNFQNFGEVISMRDGIASVYGLTDAKFGELGCFCKIRGIG